MKLKLSQTLCILSVGAMQVASGHTTYGGTARNLGPNIETAPGSGVFVPGAISGATAATPYFKTIANQTVSSNFGWAAGTQPVYGDAHRIRAFRFTLAEAGLATIQVSADPARGTAAGTAIMPAFSLYSGLLSTGSSADYDTAGITLAYLQTLGAPQPRQGAFNSLGDWKMGNDASLVDGSGNYDFSQLSSLTYHGHVADGSSANFGFASGIQGDGAADGVVRASFPLPAGNYSLIVGGAQIDSTDLRTYGFQASLTVIPEPSALLLAGGSVCALFRRRRQGLLGVD